MKALFCSCIPLRRDLGSSSTLIDIASEMRGLGWECEVLGPQEIGLGPEDFEVEYPRALARYLRERGPEFDVVDFDHRYLPFERGTLPTKPVLVARAQLLEQQLAANPFPIRRKFLSSVKHALLGWKARWDDRKRLDQTRLTLIQADRVLVLNDRDRELLVASGIPVAKIGVVPNGLDSAKATALARASSAIPADPRVAFIGTFDFRKGALDFPKIVERILRDVPTAKFKLLGTRGLFRTEKEVRDFFPESVQSRLEIMTHFEPEQLPGMLAQCSVGVFPSYVEGFGMGVLEMLAASIPVVAYDAPGPHMMLPQRYLVKTGDALGMAERIVELLRNPTELRSARLWAHDRAKEFSIERCARATVEFYLQAIKEKSS